MTPMTPMTPVEKDRQRENIWAQIEALSAFAPIAKRLGNHELRVEIHRIEHMLYDELRTLDQLI